MGARRRWCALAGALALCGGLQASSVILLSQDALIDRAEWIIYGTVLSSNAAVHDGAIPVFTDVVLEVTEVLKGTWSQPIIHISFPGGQLDGSRYALSGAPHFIPGETVCVYLRDLGNGERTTVGLSQGKYRVVEDPATGALIAIHAGVNVNRLPLTGPNQTVAQALSTAPPPVQDWTLLRRQIRERVAP